MLKPVIAATAMLAIAGSTFVYAQQGLRLSRLPRRRPAPSIAISSVPTMCPRSPMRASQRSRPDSNSTPDQTKNWPAFEQALRNMVQLRIDRMQARQAAEQQDQSQTPGVSRSTGWRSAPTP